MLCLIQAKNKGLPANESVMSFKDAMELISRVTKYNCKSSHLWWLLRTHGRALKILTDTARVVSTPKVSTALWLFLWSIMIKTTRKISQINPDVAQPEWMPPRCCNTEVHPKRNQRGDHYRERIQSPYKHVQLLILTLANNVLMIKYKNRPKSSLRMRIATCRFPRTNAPV